MTSRRLTPKSRPTATAHARSTCLSRSRRRRRTGPGPHREDRRMPELLTRRATLEPSSVDEAARTVEVTWSTGAPVRRRDRAGPYEERLSLDPAHVDVSALIGAPVLDGHRQESVDQVLGVVTAAHVDGQRGTATVKLSERAEPVWRDIKAGILRAVSVGYVVQRWQDSRANGLRTRTAIQW